MHMFKLSKALRGCSHHSKGAFPRLAFQAAICCLGSLATGVFAHVPVRPKVCKGLTKFVPFWNIPRPNSDSFLKFYIMFTFQLLLPTVANSFAYFSLMVNMSMFKESKCSKNIRTFTLCNYRQFTVSASLGDSRWKMRIVQCQEAVH